MAFADYIYKDGGYFLIADGSGPYAVNSAGDGTLMGGTGTGGGTWGTITGTLEDQEDITLALAAKADYFAAVDIAVNTALTAALHADRPLQAANGVVLTINNDATTGASGKEEFRSTKADGGTFTMVAGSATVIVPAGFSLNSVDTGGVVSVERIAANTYLCTSMAVASATAGAIYVHASSAGAADVASGSLTETVVFDWTLPAMTAKMAAEVDFLFTGSGTAGTKTWRLRLGGTGIDGTIIWTTNATAAHGQHKAGFSNDNSVSAQIGYSSGAGGKNTATGATALSTAAVNTGSAGVHLYLTMQKSTSSADTVNVKGVKGIIVPGV
jgi:hypothetical protein